MIFGCHTIANDTIHTVLQQNINFVNFNVIIAKSDAPHDTMDT